MCLTRNRRPLFLAPDQSHILPVTIETMPIPSIHRRPRGLAGRLRALWAAGALLSCLAGCTYENTHPLHWASYSDADFTVQMPGDVAKKETTKNDGIED